MENLELLLQEQVKRDSCLGLGWWEILGAGAARLRAERMQNQELARPQTLGRVGKPTFQPHREKKVSS